MIKKSVYIDKITNDLIALASFVSAKNAMSLSSDSTLVEDLVKDILNILYKYSLRNLNEGGKDYPIIDLGDEGNRICFQVTAENGRDKIQGTIEDFSKSDDKEKYDTLMFFIIGYKKRYQPFDDHGIEFDKDDHIWDMKTLLKKIRHIDIDDLIKLSEYIDANFDSRVVIEPLNLSEEDIKSVLDVLKDQLVNPNDNQVDTSRKYVFDSRGDDFIEKKNDLNNVDDNLFSNDIKPSLKYADLITAFLGDPINAEYQSKYFEIADSIRAECAVDCNMGDVFEQVFDEVINYKNNSLIDDSKLLIVLHNMYFNCDIGNNP